MKRNTIVVIIVLITFIGVNLWIHLDKKNWKEYNITFKAFDKDIKIIIYDKEGDVDKYLEQAKKIYNKYDQLTDTKKKYKNNLYVINHRKKQKELNEDLKDMIEFANKNNIYINNNELVTYWNGIFTYERPLPTKEELDKIDVRKELINIENNTITNEIVDINMDYIREYYVTNKVVDYFKDNKIDNYLINVDGNVTLGKNYEGDFSTAIMNPINNEMMNIVYGNNISIVSIGKNNTYYTINGKRYTNIINLDTKMPYDNVLSVTSVSSDILNNGINAYKIFSMDLKDSKEYIKNTNEGVLLINNKQKTIINKKYKMYSTKQK